jgi:hypothetical protein
VRLRVAALLSLACVALVAPHPAVAQDRGRPPSGSELRDTYPLDSSPRVAAERVADRSPAAPTSAAPPDRAPAVLRIAIFAMLAILAFAVGLAISVRPRRQHAREDDVAPLASRPTASPLLYPTEASTDEPLFGPAALPPATRQEWTAEVEWQQAEAGSFFCVIARSASGAGTTVIAKSEPLEWPPASAATVQRLTAAAWELETSLVAAGWRPLPPGDAWYAKRFAWEPVASTPDAHSGRFDRRRAWQDPVEPVPAQGDRTAS